MDSASRSRIDLRLGLLLYGGLHAVVDYVTVAVLFTASAGLLASSADVVLLFILYNVCAFGLQSLIGLVSDRFALPREVAHTGCLLILVAAAILNSLPLAAIVLAGIGNAFYHVGGGSISLNLTPKKATAPGIFVAPGALGVFAGTMAGRAGQFEPILPAVIIVVLVVASLLVKLPRMDYTRIRARRHPYSWLVLSALLLAIVVRSLVGLAVLLPWKANIALAITLVASVVLGKAVGGVLADRFGWINVATGSLLISIPLLAIFADVPAAAILGMFLFNFTMPITTAAVSSLLPGRPGFAFGSTCLALLIGALPVLLGYKVFSGPLVIAGAGAVAVLAVYFGLVGYRTRPSLARADSLD